MVPGIAHLRSGKCCEEKAAAPWQGGGLGEAMPEEHPKQREQQVATLEVTRGEDETQGGKALPSATADAPRATQLSRRWEPLATVVSTTPIPVSFKVTDLPQQE